MGLLQDLPTTEQLSAILAPVMGDETAGTGVAGVLQLLEGLDTGGISASLAGELDQAFSGSVAVDTSSLTGEVRDQFQTALAAIPDDPTTLVAPLNAQLETIKRLSSADLSAQLLAGVDGLQSVESLMPADTRELVAGAAESLTQLKGEFISGAFADLRAWSESVQALYAEMEPLLAGGPGTLEERLIAYLGDKMAALVQVILPQQSVAAAIATALDAAVSAERLSEINALKGALIDQMNQARAEFESGNFTNTAHLAAASAGFQQLTESLAAVAATLRSVLERESATAEGLARALQRQFDDFAEIEIVDLGNIRDKFAQAIGQVQAAIEDLDLERVRETVEGVFEQINGAIGQFDLSQFSAKLSDLQNQLQAALDALDGALFEVVASIRNIFTQIKAALQSVASTLGRYDENGDFHFYVQQEIEDFLNGVKAALQENIRPLLDQFKNTIGQILGQVQDGLNAVKGEIEAVKAQLQGMLDGIHAQLQNLDVAGQMEAIRLQLDTMLNELGVIDFNPVVDPVVLQINEMGADLKEIDVSALNEFTRGALKVSVEVVTAIDFSAQITEVLMAEIDELLEIPKGALDDIEANVEDVLQRFGELAPAALLSPLDELFEPINAHLDALDLENLLAPLDAWHVRLQAELDAISPTALLQPLIDLYAELQGAFEVLSPAELMRPLQAAVDSIKAEIQAIDITGITAELSNVIERVKAQLDEISPARLLNPLVNAFDKIMGALDGFDPAVLLEPFTRVFDALTAPLENLNADHVGLIGEAFAALRNLLNAFDPGHIFQVVRQKFAAVGALLQQINVGGLIADLKAPYDALNAAFAAGGGGAHVSLAASVADMNPLRSASLGSVAADFQQFRAKIDALAEAQPPAALVGRYDEVRPKLESLIPTWADENISPASVRRAFQLANPLNMTAEINQLYTAVKEQLRNFDPRLVQENLNQSFEAAKDALSAFDPEAIVGEVQAAIDALTQRLDAVNLQLIVDELEGIVDEVHTIVAGLNPQPIIDRLEGLVNEVTGVVEALRPAQILSELNTPLQTAKEIVAEFDPAVFKELLQAVFEEIQAVLEAVDVGVILRPLTDRLQQLRDELEEGLQRTETAFNGMLAAIPV